MDLSKLDGYKTYIGAAGFGLLGVYYLVLGDTAHAMEYFMMAVSLYGMRQAIAKPVEVKEPLVEKKAE